MADTPKIRFEWFRGGWERRKFGDLGFVAMCKRIFKEQTAIEGEIPFYKIGTFGGKPDAFISRELFEEYKEQFQYPEIGDMLISVSGTIGRIVEYTGEDAYFQDSNIVWFKHDERIDNSFLKCVYSFVKWSGIEGSTIKRLYNDNFLKTELILPSIAEQKQIGLYFKYFDSLITLYQRKCEEIKELKKYMLQKMFPHNGKKIPKIRFAGFTDEWEQRKLGEVINVCSGMDYKGLGEGEIPVYGTGGYMLSVDRALSYDKDAIGIGRKGTIDKPYILKAPFWTVDTLFYCIPKNYINLNFMYSTFQNIDWKRKDESTGVPSLSKVIINSTEIMFPSLEEQIKIGEYFHAIDNIITLYSRKCDELKEVKKFMLEKMFV